MDCSLHPESRPQPRRRETATDTGDVTLRGHLGRGLEQEQHPGPWPSGPSPPLILGCGSDQPQPRPSPAQAKSTCPHDLDRLGPTKARPAESPEGVESCSEDGQGGLHLQTRLFRAWEHPTGQEPCRESPAPAPAPPLTSASRMGLPILGLGPPPTHRWCPRAPSAPGRKAALGTEAPGRP